MSRVPNSISRMAGLLWLFGAEPWGHLFLDPRWLLQLPSWDKSAHFTRFHDRGGHSHVSWPHSNVEGPPAKAMRRYARGVTKRKVQFNSRAREPGNGRSKKAKRMHPAVAG